MKIDFTIAGTKFVYEIFENKAPKYIVTAPLDILISSITETVELVWSYNPNYTPEKLVENCNKTATWSKVALA